MAPILLLHLSDLHFGPNSRFQGRDPRKLGESFHRAVAEAQRKTADLERLPWLTEKKIDLVFVTGDIAESGLPDEFKTGEKFLTGLAGGIGINHDHFVFVPGNHDLNWGSSQEAFHALSKRGHPTEFEIRAAVDKVKFEFYDEFLTRFYATRDPREPLFPGANLYRFPDLYLTVAALDSCEKESHRPKDHVGLVSVKQARAAMQALRQPEVASWLKVVAVHHNPVVTTPANVELWRKELLDRGTLDGDLLARFEGDVLGLEGHEQIEAVAADAEVQLVLHGHHHANNTKIWPWRSNGHSHVLSAGSLWLTPKNLPREESNSARLILLEPELPRIYAWALKFDPRARSEDEVERGAFTLDTAGSEGFPQRLDLPKGYVSAIETRSRPALSRFAPAEDIEFLERFRSSFRDFFDRWDLGSLGAVRPGGVHEAKDAQLDEMYLELRFDPKFDPKQTEKGAPLRAANLLGRDRPLALCGVAGAGKTTWVRYTFRMLINEPRALPLMLVLRDVARHWQDPQCKGEERSIRVALENWVGEQMGPGWKSQLELILLAESGPRPILLVDGWDELGPLGEDFRAKLLGFLRTHPRVLAIVTSRPYGEGRPSHGAAFEALEIQPLSDGDIEAMTSNFFGRFAGEETATRDGRRFLEALERAPEARDLARTPLLLTMMLLVGYSQPLPDKRHLLYARCIDTLLHDRPEHKAERGALPSRRAWCPKGIETRRRWAATLAFRAQTAGYESIKGRPWEDRPVARRSRMEMAGFLPEDCQASQRDGFLAWLVEIAGLLAEHTDETLSFTHLSFQEYLTALHISTTVADHDQRAKAFSDRIASAHWWETLRLLAAQIEGPNPKFLDVVLGALLTDPEASETKQSFVGTVLADGLGFAKRFKEWAGVFLPHFASTWPNGADLCARAWLATRQEERKTELGNALGAQAARQSWLGWQRCEMFGEGWAKLANPPDLATTRAIVGALQDPSQFSGVGVAAGRLLASSIPLWPTGYELGILHLWPGLRRLAGLRLQSAAAAGAPRESLIALARISLLPPIEDDWERNWARQWARDWTRELARVPFRDLFRDWARYWARYWVRELAGGWTLELSHDWNRDWRRYWGRYWARDWVGDGDHDWARDWARGLACDRPRYWADYWAEKLNLDPYSAWLGNFALAEAFSLGRSGARGLLVQDQESKDPLRHLVAEACRISIDPEREPRFDLTRNPTGLAPLWPALARHIARRSTAADKTLLETAARTGGEGYPEPLCWGLQFIVRGDVLLDDGLFVTLDALADEAGVKPLPYLEEMEDELDWGDESEQEALESVG